MFVSCSLSSENHFLFFYRRKEKKLYPVFDQCFGMWCKVERNSLCLVLIFFSVLGVLFGCRLLNCLALKEHASCGWALAFVYSVVGFSIPSEYININEVKRKKKQWPICAVKISRDRKRACLPSDTHSSQMYNVSNLAPWFVPLNSCNAMSKWTRENDTTHTNNNNNNNNTKQHRRKI